MFVLSLVAPVVLSLILGWVSYIAFGTTPAIIITMTGVGLSYHWMRSLWNGII